LTNIQKTLLFVYCAIGLLYLVADNVGWPYLAITTKPMLLSTLLFYFLSANKRNHSVFSKSIIGGLIFSFIGDSLLLFEGELFFVFGLLSFLVTHLFYTRAFLNLADSKFRTLFTKRKIATGLFVLLLISLMAFLWSDLGDLRWPVLIYSSVISMMCLAAYHLKGAVSTKIFTLIFFGALLFMFSDSMIALDKFKTGQLNLPFPRLLIMIPYIVAQLMIVQGSITWLKHGKQTSKLS